MRKLFLCFKNVLSAINGMQNRMGMQKLSVVLVQRRMAYIPTFCFKACSTSDMLVINMFCLFSETALP